MPSCFSIGPITIDFLIYADHKLLSKQNEEGAAAGEEEGGVGRNGEGQLVSWCSLPEPVAVTVNPATARPGLGTDQARRIHSA